MPRLARSRLDGVYLYGSIPRGAARFAVSDLDGQVLFTSDPTDDDLRALRDLERRLAAAQAAKPSGGPLGWRP